MAIRRVSDLLGTPAPGTPRRSAPAPAKAAPKASSRALVPTQAPTAAQASGTAPPDGTPALAAELTDMTEVLDALATIVASVSDRLSDQADALGNLAKTSAETRQAAFAARAQSDPGQLAAEVTGALNEAMVPRLRELTAAVAELTRTAHAHAHGEARNRAETQLHDMTRELRAARAETLRWKGYLGAALLGGVLLALNPAPRPAPDRHPHPLHLPLRRRHLAGGRRRGGSLRVHWLDEPMISVLLHPARLIFVPILCPENARSPR
jgi:hypothetical protein